MSTAAGGMTGSNSGGNATSLPGSSLLAVEEMHFYLRRLTLGGTSKVAQIDSFGGGPDYEMFLNAVQSVGTHHGWTEAQIMRTVEMKLKNKAREYYGALLTIERPSTMDQMKNWFRSLFGRRLTMSAGKTELEHCIRNPDETLGDVNTPAQTHHRDILLVNQFMDGMEGRLANEVSQSGEFYSLNNCLQEAEQYKEVVYPLRYTDIRNTESGDQRRRTSEEEAGISKEAQGIMEQLDSPTCETTVYVMGKRDIERLDFAKPFASISDNSPNEQTDNQIPEIAAADDKGRRNAVPSAGKRNNLKGPSLVRLQNQVKKYRPDKKHANVDSLSRVRPVRYLGTEPTLEPILNRERIRRSHQDDPAVREIIGNILKNNSRDYYLDLDGVVYRKSEDSASALLPGIMKTIMICRFQDIPGKTRPMQA
ncbi:hypothetical protein JTB14_027303 [Gonioctena quinquepunctata]|nr:hypothetical protein JTB14_027303 [Gonioctena quinquepunctata]